MKCFSFLSKSTLLVIVTVSSVILSPKITYAANYTVTTSGNTGAGSLNAAITSANASVGADTISFASGISDIVLTTQLPAITDDLSVSGASAGVTVRSSDISNSIRIFSISSGVAVTLDELTMSQGSVAGSGGAVYNSGQLTLSNCTLSGNFAASGAGLSNFGGTLTITGCTFYGNKGARDNLGGAVANYNNGATTGVATIANSTFSTNSAGRGGAIYNEGTLNVHRCTFESNQSNANTTGDSVGGGAIRTTSQANIDNSTFAGNSATNNGGAILNESRLNLFSCTFAGNSAPNGGSVFNTGASTFVGNTLFYRGTTGVNFLNGGSIGALTSRGYNLSSDGTGPNNGTTDLLNTAPRLDSGLANNGGPTRTIALLAGSPAIDKGNGAGVTDAGTETTATLDQRGSQRIFDVPNVTNASGGNGSDIGAFEKGNTRPSLSGDTYTGRQGQAFNQQLSGTDPDGQTLSYSVDRGSTLPAGLSLSDSGLISGTPTARTSASGVTTRISVSDGVGDPTSAVFTFLIKEASSTVVNTNIESSDYDGVTGLREAIEAANSNPDQSNIVFSLVPGSRTLTLTNPLPTLNTDISFIAPTTRDGLMVVRSSADSTPHFVIFDVESATVNFSNLTISGGYAPLPGSGGGILNYMGKVTATNCTIFNNQAAIGGGIENYTSSDFTSSYTILRNCTLSGNTASYSAPVSGGGICNSAGKTVIESCTIVGNKIYIAEQASLGAGVFTDDGARTEVSNSLIAGNLGDDRNGNPLTSYFDVDTAGQGTFVSSGYNLIGDGNATSQFTAAGDRTGIADAALKIGALANNGGPTQTMKLLSGSPAINTGDPTFNGTGQTDQRGAGFARVQDGRRDIGAYEDQNDTPVNVSVSPATSSSGVGGARSFAAAYSDADSPDDIDDAYLLINSSLNSTNSLLCYYNTLLNKLYLKNDAGTTYIGGFAPGSANLISNSQGSLNCANTVVNRSGNTLTVYWNITPTASFTGTKNLYLFVRDSAGATDGWDDLGDWLVKSTTNAAPVNVTLTPTASANIVGTARSLTATYGDADSALDISATQLLINTSVSPTGALWCYYDTQTNKLYLKSDDGSSLIGGFAPGSSNVISNGRGSLNCAATTVSRSGNTLTVSWNVTPSASFVGVKNLYCYVKDASGATDGFDDLGDWLVKTSANTAPVNTSVSPAVSSSAAGVAKSLTTVYTDANGALDITDAHLLVNTTLNPANALWGYYDSVGNRLYLKNNAGTAFIGGFAPGSSNVVSNAQGTLNCAATTVARSGNTLTVGWNFTPSASFTGTKNLYTYVKDTSNATDGWDDLGDWTITAGASPMTAPAQKAPSAGNS